MFVCAKACIHHCTRICLLHAYMPAALDNGLLERTMRLCMQACNCHCTASVGRSRVVLESGPSVSLVQSQE